MKRAKDSTSDFSKGVKQLARELAPIIGAAGLLAITKQALEAAESINDLSQQVGLSAEEFQRYSFGASLAGVDSEKLTAAIGILNTNIATGKVAYKSTSAAILDIANQMQNAKNGIDRARIANENFGKQGKVLIPFLRQGAEGVKALGDQAQALGLVFDNELIGKADDFKDELGILHDVITRNFQRGLLEGFVGESQTIRNIYTDPQFLAGVKGIGEAFGEVAKFVVLTVGAFQEAKLALGEFFIKVAAGANFIDKDVGALALQEAADRMKKLNTPLQFNKPESSPEGDFNFTGDYDKAVDKLNESLKDSQFEAYKLRSSFDEVDTKIADIVYKAGLLKKEGDSFKIPPEFIGQIKQLNDALTEIEQRKSAEKIIKDSKEAVDIFNESLKELNSLLAEGYINQQQYDKALSKSADTFMETDAQAKKFTDTQKENARILKESLQGIAGDLAGGIKDAIFGAKSLGDAFKDVASKIAEAVIEAQLLKAITAATDGFGDGAGGGLGSLGSLFDFLPSFDVGTSRVPRDMPAMVHKNEIIVPANQADSIRANGGFGGGVTMNIYTPDASSFRASDRQIARQLKSRVAGA